MLQLLVFNCLGFVLYGKRLLEFVGFYLKLCDAAVHESDGEHLLKCWRYLLPYSKVPREETFFKSILNMLCLFQFELSRL